MKRVYLDWNATAPLRAEAKEAIYNALEHFGNPSSIHKEGRAAKSILEKARGAFAELFGVQHHDIIFNSGATESAAYIMAGRDLSVSALEHDAVYAWGKERLPVDARGKIHSTAPHSEAIQYANSETGIIQDLPTSLALTDITQAAGKLPFAFKWSEAHSAILSPHKFGGAKGVGVVLLKETVSYPAQLKGGGQEMRHRSGTENIIGIAAAGAAAKAAHQDLSKGVWEDVRALRDYLEEAILTFAPDALIVGKADMRLPNTSMIIIPHWPGHTQVMVMDLEGFAISAGSACSSGKLNKSRVLRAMGYKAEEAQCSIRISIGPDTKRADIDKFLIAYQASYVTYKTRVA